MPIFAAIQFDFPLALWAGLPLAAWAVTMGFRSQRRRGLRTTNAAWLAALRGSALLLLVLLAAKPVWVASPRAQAGKTSVVLLVDRSESMSLEENGTTRYEQSMTFARDLLLPSLEAEDLSIDSFVFAEDVQAVQVGDLASLGANGKRSNLAGAIARTITAREAPPLAIVALTDGAVNESADNARALSALVDGRVPFVAVGFGSDVGARTLSLRQVDAPPAVAPNTTFNISAQMEMVSPDPVPAFDLVLFRDGKMMDQKRIDPGKGSRFWMESFRVTEKELGVYQYSLQFLPPPSPGMKSVNTIGSTSVRITNERELRVLYVQGALTWDYKFVSLALRGDSSLKLTGLTRTSKQSVFRQNIESAGELLNGFPTALEEMAPYRVIVLSNLKPIDLAPAQQELLARFCSELGGGILMIGGPDTFDFSWKRSRLEQLLPVVLAANQGVRGLDRPCRMVLEDQALQHPVFQVDDHLTTREIWSSLPPFTHYGRVDALKPGAHVWARHHEDDGPEGKRILMAWQRYGSGISAVICLQNFWRWRLAKDAEPAHFDRFWRQLFRFISESSRQDVIIHLADQDLRPQMDVKLLIERQPSPQTVTETNQEFVVRVENAQSKKIQEQRLNLTPGRPVDLTFRAETAGTYNVTVCDGVGQAISSRAIEIRDVNVEFENTARNMETLRQWAAVSDGLALKAEDCRDGEELVAQVRKKVAELRRLKPVRQPVGINAWTLVTLLGCLGGEWMLRKRWNLL